MMFFILVALAIEKGYFAEYGLNIEFVNANENANAMTLLSTGQVDVVSNSGTASPLQNIAAGVDMTIFGGHMVQGCMPVVARKQQLPGACRNRHPSERR